MKILITGTAGFIGFHLAKRFVENGFDVIGMDNINDYYPTSLKFDRLRESGIIESAIHYNQLTKSIKWSNYQFLKLNLEDADGIIRLFQKEQFEMVIHMAAQAGVQYSMENPKSYLQSNVVGFLNILEACRQNEVDRLVYASSSSVYGIRENELLSITDRVDTPVSIYAATKKSNELMAHVYSYSYQIKTIGLRLFTVYGPWGRPDMSPSLFTDAILNGKTIQLFNNGNMQRDYTFIDDIVEGIFGISQIDLMNNYSIFNVGNNSPVRLTDFINCLESELGREAKTNMVGMQPGDVLATWADTKELATAIGYKPKTNIRHGVKKFVEWYKNYYSINRI